MGKWDALYSQGECRHGQENVFEVHDESCKLLQIELMFDGVVVFERESSDARLEDKDVNI